MIGRRAFIAGLFVAPAIIRPGLLMPIRPLPIIRVPTRWKIVGRMAYDTIVIGHPAITMGDMMAEIGECVVKLSPMHGVIRVGDSVWIDQNTGEVV